MADITLAIDEETLAKVRRYAARRETSVDAIVREHLDGIARTEDRLKDVVAELKRLSETSPAALGPGYVWRREDSYGR
ncbi:DUF6364 family protein [Prosthecomicrobium pneumaticum]|uniref:Uncharacterized protein n=1 Tax=Prosthecomicrobium pneumaticum TaxID=81895 RepID=A0A7W9FMU3_9HYPH|nr:DUF6364 family protein [Prosthecomicrobium pneumaticum]MBB5753610.1 hypothetical protein [Prosthecomicrobium pneumaticum]